MQPATSKGKILCFLLLVVSLPLLQHVFSFFESGPLHGAISGVANPGFEWDKWWSGRYQEQKSAYLNDSTGCRNDMVRLNNQLDFWLFRKFHAHSVVIGKDDCLFEQEYVDEYYGMDYTGHDNMLLAVDKLRKVQDTLEHMGKTFVFLCAPSKAYYFADKLPAPPHGYVPGTPTNYATFTRLADSLGVHVVDYNGWFQRMKPAAQDPLMVRLGIHWSTYGSVVAADSFIKYIEHARHIRMTELQWQNVEHTTTPRLNDDDLAVGLNLIYPMRPEMLSYPQKSYVEDSTTAKPHILYIGDSFLWIWLYDDLMQHLSHEFDIWYYFVESWNQNTTSGKEPPGRVDNIDWHSRLMSSDVISILYVPSSFSSFARPNSAIDKLYDYFYPAVH